MNSPSLRKKMFRVTPMAAHEDTMDPPNQTLRRRELSAGATGSKKEFRVPFGPYLIPGLSIASCLYIMKDLSMTTYSVFGVWMGLAIIGYFVYGMRHSQLAKQNS